MDFKDTFYIIGILTSLMVSIFTIRNEIKNRRNSLREHIYIEQLNSISDLILMFTRFNKEIDSLINFSNRRQSNDFNFHLEELEKIILNNQYLLPNEIIKESRMAIQISHQLYLDICDDKRTADHGSYDNYYGKYFQLIALIRKHFGIDQLSKENQKIHGMEELISSEKLRDYRL